MTKPHKALLLLAFFTLLSTILMAQETGDERAEYLYEKEHPLRETRCGSLIRRGHPRKISCLLGSERTMKLARPNVYAGLPHQKNTNPVLRFRLSQDFRTRSERC